MEEICEHIRQGQDGGGREFYQSLLVNVNNLGRMEWVVDENPLIVAVECDRLDLVDAFIHLGVHVNAIQKLNNCTKTPLNEALKKNSRNMVELLLKRGASLNLPEINPEGQEVYPTDLARDNSSLLKILSRRNQNRKISYN